VGGGGPLGSCRWASNPPPPPLPHAHTQTLTHTHTHTNVRTHAHTHAQTYIHSKRKKPRITWWLVTGWLSIARMRVCGITCIRCFASRATHSTTLHHTGGVNLHQGLWGTVDSHLYARVVCFFERKKIWCMWEKIWYMCWTRKKMKYDTNDPLHRIEFGPPKFFFKTFKFSIIFYSTFQKLSSGGGHFRKACRFRKKESRPSEITCKQSKPDRTISKIQKRREFVQELCNEQCPKNSFKRLYIVKGLLLLVEKASFSK